MAGSIKINTQAVRSTAQQVDRLNKTVNSSLDELTRMISNLNGNWDGSGSEHAIETFGRMRADYYNARFDQVDNFVRYLARNVAGGYESAESNNRRLSDSFK